MLKLINRFWKIGMSCDVEEKIKSRQLRNVRDLIIFNQKADIAISKL